MSEKIEITIDGKPVAVDADSTVKLPASKCQTCEKYREFLEKLALLHMSKEDLRDYSRFTENCMASSIDNLLQTGKLKEQAKIAIQIRKFLEENE